MKRVYGARGTSDTIGGRIESSGNMVGNAQQEEKGVSCVQAAEAGPGDKGSGWNEES